MRTFTTTIFSISFALFLCLLSLNNQLYAQIVNSKPLPTREVSGVIKSSSDQELVGASVKLTSDKDTLVTRTNEDGIFIFKNVKSATYSLEIKSVGFNRLFGNYKQNDAVPRIIMDPILLKSESTNIDEVVISGTPSIVYKTDTVEYKAKDYVVRENATIDELMKKMEGMEVGTDGSVVHQGQNVTKAKVNGKTYLGGDVGTVIQNLPAEIVEKIQIVDDYGDQAARTGIKDGDPQKILNIVTRTDKSVGNTLNLSAGAGNNERYESSLFATRLNGNQTIGLNARLNNTVNGVASSSNGGGNTGLVTISSPGTGGGGGGVSATGGRGNGGGGNASGLGGGGTTSSGSGGTTNSGNSSFSIRDKVGAVLEYTANYAMSFNNVNSINSSESQLFSSLGTTFASNESNSLNKSQSHNLNFDLEFNFNKKNYLRVQPNFSYTSSNGNSNSSIFQTGLIHQDQTGSNNSKNIRPNFGSTVFYQYYFDKARRNFTAQFSFNSSKQDGNQENNSNILYYDNNSNIVLKDSLIHRMIERNNITNNTRGSITYVEPLSGNTQLEFNGQVNRNNYDNDAITSNILKDGRKIAVDSLSNIYNYSFTESRISVNYRYGLSNTSKFRMSLGLTGVPAVLKGTKASLGTSTERTSFNLIPIARFQYLWSRQHSVQVNYNGNASEPSFDQIQPVRDVSSPQNPVVGNPNLKVAFNHNVNTSYNNYITNSKLNISVNANASFTENAISRNIVQIKDEYNSLKNETRYVNLNGVYRLGGNYSLSKQLNNRKYNLSTNGMISYNHGVSMSNNLLNFTDTWNFTQRFGPRINPNEWLEINPSIAYRFLKSNNSLPTSLDSRTETISLNIDGRFIMWKSLIFGYSASKNFVSGINANVTNNPFVINSYIQQELWKRRGTVTLQAFDILNQNNFVNRNVSDQSIVDTKSNALSRYFMVKLSMRLQKWSGAQGRGGREIIRRGDGSFGM